MNEPDNEHRQPEQAPDEETTIKELFLLAALWLPLGFFLWFYFGAFLIRPTVLLVDAVAQATVPELVSGLSQVQYKIQVDTWIPNERTGDTAKTLVNPLIYAYGIPLFFGLVLATPPLSAARRLLQLGIGYVLLTLVQCWGVFWEIMKDLSLRMGPLAAEMVADTGLSATLVALCYQLGYLILPAVTPIALWILLNRDFLSRIARPMRTSG